MKETSNEEKEKRERAYKADILKTALKIAYETSNVPAEYKNACSPDDLRAALVIGDLRKDDIGLMTGIHLTRRLLARLAEMTAYAAIERRMDRAFNRMWACGIMAVVLVSAAVITAITFPFVVLGGFGCALAWVMYKFMDNLRHYRFYRDKLVHGRWLVPGGIDVGQAYVDFYDNP